MIAKFAAPLSVEQEQQDPPNMQMHSERPIDNDRPLSRDTPQNGLGLSRSCSGVEGLRTLFALYGRVKIGLGLTIFSIFAVILFAIPRAAGQTDCRWDGTSPLCDGECGAGETEITRLATAPGGGGPPYYYGPTFGAACATGTKALCCKMSGVSCRWDGTAPFCDGECGNGETKGQPPAGSSSGNACVTGSKVYCCHSTRTGTSSSALEANPEFTRYATFWEKSGGPEWQARHGLSATQYQQAFNTLTQQGYRLVEISGYSVENKDTYAAIWEKSSGPAWVARHGLTSSQYQQEFDKLTGQGYRLVDICGYTVAGQDHYAAIWEKRQGPAWVARHGLTSSQYQQEFDKRVGQGYRLVDISGYNVGGQDHYAAIWEKSSGPAWVARNGLTSSQYQQEFNTFSQQGYRLVRIRGWRSGNTTHYAAIWAKAQGPAWVARHGLLSDIYQEEFDKLSKEGYRLKHVSGYHTYN